MVSIRRQMTSSREIGNSSSEMALLMEMQRDFAEFKKKSVGDLM